MQRIRLSARPVTRVCAALLLPSLAATAAAQTVEHYWDFTATADLVSGVATIAVATPDMSVHATYGEAYPGAGNSLNSVLGGTSAGGGYLEAAVLSGGPVFMEWNLDSYSFSYWVWDDFLSDGEVNGPRVFDNLAGTSTGIQLGTNANGFWNLRNDDDNGAANIFDNLQQFLPPTDRWVHIVGVTDRAASEVRLYVDGVLSATAMLIDTATSGPFTGNIFPTQDLQIGVINGGTNNGQSQTSGLDDLAFYRGVLSQADITGLASGALSPLDFRHIGTRYCSPGVPNSTGASGRLTVSGSDVAVHNAVLLGASALPLNAFGFFLTSRMQGLVAQPGGSVGVLCLSGSIGRYVGAGQIKNSGTTGAFSLTLDLTQTPTPSGLVTVMAGDTWNFQAWHRDASGGGAVSNFTDAVSVLFQ